MQSPKELMENLNVAIYYDPYLEYSNEAPYSPQLSFPEYPLKSLSKCQNHVYESLRKTLFLMGLDKENFGSQIWNPLKEIVEPGNTVVIKPNFVLDRHENGGDIFSIITHPSIIRAIVDYVYIALKGEGKIIIADAPQMDCNFGRLIKLTNLDSIVHLYKDELDFDIEVYDLRDFWLDVTNAPKAAYSKYRHELPGDPLGGSIINLGEKSLLYELKNSKNFYGADYNRDETIKHHHDGIQEYLISNTILSADVVISVPKLKVHKKTGITINVKGLVGINLNKNYLVHYRLGTPSEGGDQYPDNILSRQEETVLKLQRAGFDILLSKKTSLTDTLYEFAVGIGRALLKPLGFELNKEKAIFDGGNWYGNDSAWRMAIDLLRIFIYSDKRGNLRESPCRRVFSIVDGIIGGEGNGPLAPDKKKCGLIVAGTNFCAVDWVCARLMGFNDKKLKILNYPLLYPEVFHCCKEKIMLHTNTERLKGLLDQGNKERYFSFRPHKGWEGYIDTF